MLFMLLFSPRVDQYVIDEYHEKSVQLWHNDRDHQVHKVGRSIGKAK
jgi:hypothetical protein